MNKLNLLITIVLSTILIGLVACDSSDDSPVEPTFRMRNENDSLVFCKMITEIRDAIPNAYENVNLEDISTWTPIKWALDHKTGQRRIYYLFLMGSDSVTTINIPPCISKLDYLEELYIESHQWGGDIPQSFCQLTNLERLYIKNTNISSLPDNLFTDKMIEVTIVDNKKLDKVPPSVKMLDNGMFVDEFYFYNNNFSGKCPMTTSAVDFSNNNFSSVDWTNTYTRYRLYSWENPDEVWDEKGAILKGNRLKGAIPSEVLKDTVRIYYFIRYSMPQQEGYGFTNAPSSSEIQKMKNEYIKNHPQDVDLFD